MRRSTPLTMTVEWVRPDNPERCAEAMMEFLASCVDPALHRAVADTPGALAEARRVLTETAPVNEDAKRAAEIAELERMQAQIDARLRALQATG